MVCNGTTIHRVDCIDSIDGIECMYNGIDDMNMIDLIAHMDGIDGMCHGNDEPDGMHHVKKTKNQ